MGIKGAKGTFSCLAKPLACLLGKSKPADGSSMDEGAVWDKRKPKPAVMVSDLHKWVADVNMRRAKEAAIISDNALLEARKQQQAARYHSQQALLYEAAALRALRHGGKGPSIEPPAPLKINEYPAPPDAYFSSPTLPSPPGWEAPGATEAPLHGSSPMNAFRISAHEASAPWLVAAMEP